MYLAEVGLLRGAVSPALCALQELTTLRLRTTDYYTCIYYTCIIYMDFHYSYLTVLLAPLYIQVYMCTCRHKKTLPSLDSLGIVSFQAQRCI